MSPKNCLRFALGGHALITPTFRQLPDVKYFGDATTAECQVVHTNISACLTFLLSCMVAGMAALPP